MKSKKRTHETVLVLDKGEEVVSTLAAFAKQNQITSAHFTGMGAFSDARIGYFDVLKKDYFNDRVNGHLDVLSLIGDIVFDNDEPTVQAHVVVGMKNGAATGGRLLEAHVLPTLELVLQDEGTVGRSSRIGR